MKGLCRIFLSLLSVVLPLTSASLDTTGVYLPENPSVPEKQITGFPYYHLAHPLRENACPGDPNPAYYYKGRYHLHYLYSNKNTGGLSYAHVSSEDMLHWNWHPTVLAPKTMGHAMFSGTGFFTKEGKVAMIYHGWNSWSSRRNCISYALDDNLDRWSAPEPIKVNDTKGKPHTFVHWDPDCWINNEYYYAINGGKKGASLMRSKDLKTWTFLGDLMHKDFPKDLGVSRNEDISCANMFKLGKKWILLCISHELGCRYYIGDFKDEKFLPESHALMNWNEWDFFAPESLLTKDGRRVFWSWMKLDPKYKRMGLQSLPREIELPDDGVLRIRPARELKSLRGKHIRKEDLQLQDGSILDLPGMGGQSNEFEFNFQETKAREYGVDILCNSRGSEGSRVRYNSEENTLSLGESTAPLELHEGETLSLRIFVDKSIIEVFANDRQSVVGVNNNAAQGSGVRLFAEGEDLTLRTVDSWEMQTVWSGNSVFIP